MISYCATVVRPKFVRMLIEDLIRKTKTPYEILLWLNVHDPDFEAFLGEKMRAGIPVKIIGKADNIGMVGFKPLFEKAAGSIITQIDDDVIRISPGMAETAEFIFGRRKDVRHLSAAMWEGPFCSIYGQDRWEKQYTCFDRELDLHEGPIDGWFSMYHRDIRDMLLEITYQSMAISIGYTIAQKLRATKDLRPALCKPLQVFHVKGPVLLNYYDMLDVQIWKLRQLKVPQKSIDHFANSKSWVSSKEQVEPAVQQAYREVDQPVVLPAQQASS